MMGRHSKGIYIVLSILTLVILVGCSFGGEESGIYQNEFVNYPDQISEGSPFSIKGEYLTSVTGSEEVKVNLTIRQLEDDRGVYDADKTFTNKSKKYIFQDIILTNVKSRVYFKMKLIVDGQLVGSLTTANNPTVVEDTLSSFPDNWHTNITTTSFGADDAKATWGNYLKDENPFFFALPYRNFSYFVDGKWSEKDYYGITNVKNRWIEIHYPEGNKTIYAQWEDVGPWNYYDPHYVFSTDDARPYAEMGIDMGWTSDGYRSTNKAGLDISPTAMSYLTGYSSNKITVNWRFVTHDQVPEGPWTEKISTTTADSNILNLKTQTLRTLD